MKKPGNILSRTSSITNSFVQAIIPVIEPTIEETEEALAILGMTPSTKSCCYCGDPSTTMDHFHPLVRDKRPTGYIHEVRNLVPSCGRCNSSKGQREWRKWMLGSAKHSPRTRGVPDLDARVERLQKFEAWGQVERRPLGEWAGTEAWNTHWKNLESVIAKMAEAHTHSLIVKKNISDKFHALGVPSSQVAFASERGVSVED